MAKLKQQTKPTTKLDPVADLRALLLSRHTLLWINTREELRVERAIGLAAQSAQFDVAHWDCATGKTDSQNTVVDERMRDPMGALMAIRNSATREVWVLRDLHRWMQPPIVRMLRSLARELEEAEQMRTIIILSPVSEIPPDLVGNVTVIDWPLPTREQMGEILDAAIEGIGNDEWRERVQSYLNENGRKEAAIDSAMGLTATEAANCFAKSLVVSKVVESSLVSAEKRRVIAREKVLQWVDPDPRGLEAVGGLENLKKWLGVRRLAFSKKAREYGIPAPKGCLFVGIPGCGKSLTAKAVATAWGLPLLRMDLGGLKSKWVGESEANIRKALQVAETVSPCVLWLDELEKALGGATSGAADGGVSSDALGQVLLWLQERTASVFVIATANNVEALPAELMRKGRWDEMFFIDLPTPVERVAILEATLNQYGRKIEPTYVQRMAEKTNGFSGAEIAALVPDAMFTAFADGGREITFNDLVAAAEAVVPMSKSSEERIRSLREWAKGRCRPASITEESRSQGKRRIDLN